MKKIKKYVTPKTFHIKDAGDICQVKPDFFNEIKDRQEALSFGVEQHLELQRVLMIDAKSVYDLYIGPMKISNGLYRTLEELNHRWPNLLDEIFAVGRRLDGQRLGIC
jgi:hypothetical protein